MSIVDEGKLAMLAVGMRPPSDREIETQIRQALDPSMWWTFGFCMITIFVLFTWILVERLAVAEAEDQMEELRELARVQIEVEHPKAAPAPASAQRGSSTDHSHSH